jgi:altronate dehydratase
MDVNASPIADGEATIKSTGQRLFELRLEVAGGAKT